MILLQLPGHASFMILTGTERNAFLVRVYVIAAVLNVALSVLLTRQLGPIGPALGSLFTVIVVDLCILPWHVCHEFGFAYRDYVRKSLLPLLPALAAAASVALSSKYLHVPQNTVVTLLMVGLVALVAWSAWGLWGIDAVRRGSYMRTARAVFPRLAPHAS
jgi:O-antigen/teichoic acid export membrane protein